jgi:hypothetical protein
MKTTSLLNSGFSSRIIQLHPGKDGITRVVSIKTTSGILKRAVNRISILPMDNDHEEANDKEVQ